MKKLSLPYHWNTSLKFGTDVVNIDEITKKKINQKHMKDNSILLKNSEIDIFQIRRTIREFEGNYTMTFDELSTILCNSVRQKIKLSNIECPSPSAGGLYPIDIYIIANNVQGLHPYIYKYIPLKHGLAPYSEIGDHIIIENMFLNQPFALKEKYSISILFLLDVDAIGCKYGERGYRYAHLEAGHIAQNLQLVSSKLDLKSVPVGGYIDYDINKLLNLDNGNYIPIYAVFIGK